MPSATSCVNSTETSSKPTASRPTSYSDLRKRARDAADVGAALRLLLVRKPVLGDDVGDSEPAARFEHPGDLQQDLRLVGREVDHTVGDDDVDRVGGQGDLLDQALEEDGVPDPGVGGVLARQREHLVGHVEPVREAGRPDALGGQDDVDSSAGTQVEDGLAFAELGDRRRVAASERGEGGSVRKLAALLEGVERRAEVLARVALAAGAAPAAAPGSFGHGNRGLGVLAPYFVAQGVGSGHRSASSRSRARSTSPARRVLASGVSEKYAHLPRCSRSSRPASTSRFR